MGYCIVHCHSGQLVMKELNVLRLNSRDENAVRLKHIYNKVAQLIRTFRPDSFAIEAPFFGKNVQSMLKLGRAQGVAIAAAIGAGLDVSEYSPKKIKQSITGNGNADKEQVWKMLQHMLMLKDHPLEYYDASDALAVAVCHHFQGSSLLKLPPKQHSWKTFLAANPDRVAKREQ